MNERLNNDLEAVVNKGIAALLLFDIRAGVRVMREGHVPHQIIKRIILNPKSRRATDWKVH